MSLAQITEKIRNDAQKEADEILAKAKAQAEALTSRAERECAEIQAGFDDRFGAERPEIMKRREIVANIDVSKMMLSAKRELRAVRCVVGIEPRRINVFFSVSDYDQFVFRGHAAVEKIRAEAEISGGFILRRGRISVNCSWEMLLKVSQEKQESDVVKRLFPSA